MTIHQPRTDILELMDQIILLSMGQVVWFGTTPDAISHFASLNYNIPPNTNPADYFMDIITVDHRTSEQKEESTSRIQLFIKEFQKLTPKQIGPPIAVINSNLGKQRISWPSTLFHEFSVLLYRNMLEVLRNRSLLFATIGQALFRMLN